MTDDELETLRDWWDGLRKDEQLAAYIAEKSNAIRLSALRLKADGLVMGLTMDELRVAVATADQYHPQWRRSLQNGPFHAESKE